MLLREDEARQRWCPHARIPLYAAKPAEVESPASANRPMPGTDAHVLESIDRATRCISSGCMAWRWEPMRRVAVAKGSLTDEDRRALAEAGPSGTYIEVVPMQDGPGPLPEPMPRYGYCGLAGKPCG